MNNLKSICVFASSSNDLEDIYYKETNKLGVLLGKNGYNIVFGGSELGLMGEITKSAKNNGSHITGVMPERLYNFGISKGCCDEFIITQGMRERKAKMDEISDGIIALPGGFGTLEEVSEMIVQKQLGYNHKPIILFNIDNYYSFLINFFNQIINKNFAPKCCEDIYFVANSSEDVLSYLKNYKFEETDYIKDKIKLKN